MYGNFNYNPFSYGSIQTQQPNAQRMNEMQQQMMPQYSQYTPGVLQGPQNAQMLKGRVVGSIEEAKAAQVDLDGSVTYFASPGEGRIYAKSIGMNGLPIFQVYELLKNEPVAQAASNAQDSNDLVQRIAALEEKVKELTKHDESNANV